MLSAATRARSAFVRRRRPLGPSSTSSRATPTPFKPSKWTPISSSLSKSKPSAAHAAPNTGWLAGLVDLDAKGFVLTDASHATSCPGIFAVGDVRAGSVKRVASAVGEGSVVISKVWDHVAAAKAGLP